MDVYINDSDYMILSYLACSNKPEILINYLNINDSMLEDDIYHWIYDLIMEKHANQSPILDYALANLNQTTSR